MHFKIERTKKTTRVILFATNLEFGHNAKILEILETKGADDRALAGLREFACETLPPLGYEIDVLPAFANAEKRIYQI